MSRSRLAASVFAVLLVAVTACGGEPDSGVRIVRATATATPAATADATPTPGADGESTPTPTPEPVELPPRPDNPFTGGVSVARYLAGGGADIAACLPDLAHAWELSEIEGERCAALDIDGDGRDELLYLVTIADDPLPAGEAWFFEDQDEGYRFFSSARALANEVLSGLSLLAVADLTGDGNDDAVLTSETCGATTCTTDVIIASAHRGILEDLAPPGAGVASLESGEVRDADDDGLPDVVLRGGLVASAGAGPQRGSTRLLSWTGLRFAQIDRADPAEYLIHQIADADEAFRLADYPLAIERYTLAATDQALRDYQAELGQFAGRREIIPYAWFRAALAAQRQGDVASMQEYLERASQGFSGSMHGVAAEIYRQAIAEGFPATTACSAAEDYLENFADAFARFWDYGFANPEHTIAEFCR